MPTVLRADGFQVRIFANDHPPAHVHVYRAGTSVTIALASGGRPQAVREVAGMSAANIVKAFLIVEDHHEYLSEKWEQIHG